MKLEGRVYKSGRFWLAEIPALDLMTQATTRAEAYEMAKSVVEEAVEDEKFRIALTALPGGSFYIESNNTRILIAFMLKQQRARAGLSVREASKNMGSDSPNAFGAYEQGRITPSVDKLEELLKAVSASSYDIKVG